jgi:hypothetical protein
MLRSTASRSGHRSDAERRHSRCHWTQLAATIAERLPDSSMVVDVVPEEMPRMVGRRPDTERATKLWTWVFNAGDHRHNASSVSGPNWRVLAQLLIGL